jgi:neurofibromin 1
MTLVLAICETCPASDVDGMISVLLNMFDTRSSLMTLIKLMIDREVTRTGERIFLQKEYKTADAFAESEASLFRSNSTCARFLSAFARIHGYNYLRSLIIPLIKCMESVPLGYELDPSKAQPGQDVTENRKQVEFVAASFLEILESSTPTIPS